MSQFLGSSFFGSTLEGFNGIDNVGTFEGYVNLQEASLESTAVIEGAYASLFVAEAAVNRQVSTGHMTLESVQGTLEAAGGGVLTRIKQAFVRLLEKIKGWIANLRKNFDIMTKKGAEFVSKFKSEIEKKSPTGFKYSGYDWKLSEGDNAADRATGSITGLISSIVGASTDKATKAVSAGRTADGAAKGLGKDSDAEAISNHLVTRKANLLKAVGSDVSELSEVSKHIEKAFRGEEGKKEIEAFGKINRMFMMEYIKDNKKKIEGIEKNNERQQKAIREVIDAIGKAESNYAKATAAGGSNSNVTGVMTQMSKDAQFGINVITAVTSTQKSMHSQAASEFEGALKSFLRYKSGKSTLESAGTEVDAIQSVIESTIGGFTN